MAERKTSFIGDERLDKLLELNRQFYEEGKLDHRGRETAKAVIAIFDILLETIFKGTEGIIEDMNRPEGDDKRQPLDLELMSLLLLFMQRVHYLERLEKAILNGDIE